jgi:hypothetical protein
LPGGASAATFEKAPVVKPGANIPVDFPKLVTLAFDHASQLGARTENVYVGKRSVRLTLFADRNRVAAGETGHATIYALARHDG